MIAINKFRVFIEIISCIPLAGDENGISTNELAQNMRLLNLLENEKPSTNKQKRAKINNYLKEIAEAYNFEIKVPVEGTVSDYKWIETDAINDIESNAVSRKGYSPYYRIGERSKRPGLTLTYDEVDEITAVNKYLTRIGALEQTQQFSRLAKQAEFMMKAKNTRFQRKAPSIPIISIHPSGLERERKNPDASAHQESVSRRAKILTAIRGEYTLEIIRFKDGNETIDEVIPLTVGIKDHSQYLVCFYKESSSDSPKPKLYSFDVDRLHDVRVKQEKVTRWLQTTEIDESDINKALQFYQTQLESNIILEVQDTIIESIISRPFTNIIGGAVESPMKSEGEYKYYRIELKPAYSLELEHYLLAHLKFIRIISPPSLISKIREFIRDAQKLNPVTFDNID